MNHSPAKLIFDFKNSEKWIQPEFLEPIYLNPSLEDNMIYNFENINKSLTSDSRELPCAWDDRKKRYRKKVEEKISWIGGKEDKFRILVSNKKELFLGFFSSNFYHTLEAILLRNEEMKTYIFDHLIKSRLREWQTMQRPVRKPKQPYFMSS